MNNAYISTMLPFIHVEVYNGKNKICDTLVKPDDVNDILNKYDVKDVTYM